MTTFIAEFQRHLMLCPPCGGEGEDQFGKTCRCCGGGGYVLKPSGLSFLPEEARNLLKAQS